MPGLSQPIDPTTGLWSLIAHHLRFLRTQKGNSQANVGAIINASVPTVSRIERGELHLDDRQAAALDKAWDTGGLFGYLVYYANRGHDADWHAQQLHIEVAAHLFRIYEALVFPAMFQTEAYARALILSGRFASRVDEIVSERMRRATILTRDDPPDVWAIFSQNALDWPVGGPGVMKEQLDHILTLARSDHIGVRVLPRSSGEGPGVDGSFKIMTMETGDVVYSESSGGGRLVQESAEVRAYQSKYERIGGKALSHVDSLELIQRTMEGTG